MYLFFRPHINWIAFFIFFCYFAQYTARGSNRDNICGDALCDNASGPDDGIVAYGYATQDDRPGTDPHIVPYGNRQSDFQSRIPLLRVKGVFCCCKQAVWGDKYMIPKSDFTAV